MKLLRQLFRFGLVGCAAFGLHLLTVIHLVEAWLIPPLIANILGFLLAFQISYWGHYKWTFDADRTPHKRALARFFSLACFGFLVNETLYAGLLHVTRLSYDIVLFFILLLTAALTFVLSKLWAFR